MRYRLNDAIAYAKKIANIETQNEKEIEGCARRCLAAASFPDATRDPDSSNSPAWWKGESFAKPSPHKFPKENQTNQTEENALIMTMGLVFRRI